MRGRGLVFIERGILDHPSFKAEDFTEREAFLWFIFEASYQDRVVRTNRGKVALKRGQLTASSRFMAQKWGWKEPRVRRFLNRLKNDAMIDAVSDAAQTVITICNYEKYQNFTEYRDTKTTQQTTRERRSKDAVATQTITPEETPEVTPEVTPEESCKPIAKQKINSRVKSPAITCPDFERFWKLYPRKASQKRAKTSFNKAIKGGVTAQVIIDGVIAFKQELERTKIEEEYLPYPATWLNEERWTDEYTTDHTSTSRKDRKTTQSERLHALGQALWKEIEGDNSPGPDHRFDSGAAPIRLVSGPCSGG